jgi:hypothetical protein
MDELGLSLNEAAEKSGVPADRLDLAVAQNYVAWHSFELTAIADALSCSIDYLCGREERRSAEPERDLTEADAREIHDSQTQLGEFRWDQLTANARIRRLDIINAARRYRPPSRAEKMQAAIDLLGTRHPEAVAVLEAARVK